MRLRYFVSACLFSLVSTYAVAQTDMATNPTTTMPADQASLSAQSQSTADQGNQPQSMSPSTPPSTSVPPPSSTVLPQQQAAGEVATPNNTNNDMPASAAQPASNAPATTPMQPVPGVVGAAPNVGTSGSGTVGAASVMQK
ncbi:MAG: hypothetical protein A3E83_08010 [Gammaproteobacteria bacterium RIFCSPHIGHO2_12_FULL_41_20]|nr:MAG: hypothetical protein A3E83_08010 [Gammaproteobacteria bacterium RIFCSPHIGHO2_12_FULL_41_20]